MAIVRVENLSKVYGCGATAVTALDRVSLQVEEGEFVAIMGPSGCGKSTLLHLIGGLDRPTEGTVWLGGKDLSSLNDTQLSTLRRQKIGFVFQFYNLIPVLDSAQNAALPLILDGVPQARALTTAHDWLSRMGLDGRWGSRPSELSGGQQQRVAIARALVAEPALVLADEPTGNLDSRAGDEIAVLLRQTCDNWGRSVLLVTHDPRIAAYSDRIVFLKDGRVIEEAKLSGDHDVEAANVLHHMEGMEAR